MVCETLVWRTVVPVNPLDRASRVPLWAQLERELERRLHAGEFDEGMFPTDLQLREMYGVSRHTVREAIRHLNSTGVLKRVRGRGTVVDRSEFEQSLGTLYSLFRSVEASGVAQTSEVLELRTVIDDVVAARLDLDAGVELVLLSRLRLAGGEPLAIDRAWLPASVAAPLLDADWSHTALYDELRRIGAPVPTHGWERLSAIAPSPSDRTRLGMAASGAVFSLERLGYHDGVAVEWRTTTIRGDRFRFFADWSPGAPSSLRPTPLDEVDEGDEPPS